MKSVLGCENPIGWILEQIRYAAAKIYDKPHECLLVMDPLTGEIIHEISGLEDEVKVDPMLTLDMIVIHNHPKNLTFSGADLAVSAEQNCAMAVVATTTMLCYLERPEAGWPDPAGIYLDSVMEGVIYGEALNTDNDIRDSSIHHLSADMGAFYWIELEWLRNLIDGKRR